MKLEKTMRLWISVLMTVLMATTVNAAGECSPGEIPTSCDDGIDCTHDTCIAGVCIYTPIDARCYDGLICNGPEYCDPETGCSYRHVDVCPENYYCMEYGGGWCSMFILDFNWDGDVDAEDYAIFSECLGETVTCFPDVNGLYRMPADGDDACCVVNSYDEGTPPVYTINMDDFDGFDCDPEETPTTCNDDIYCTNDTCEGGWCVYTPWDWKCDDYIYCNGAEVCSPTEGCIAPNAGDPCEIGTYCMEKPHRYQCSECIFDFNHSGHINWEDFWLLEYWCMGTEVVCDPDVNGLLRIPSDRTQDCCSMNSHHDDIDPAGTELINHDDFYGLADCYGDTVENCANCDGPTGDPYEWPEPQECIYFSNPDDPYCDEPTPACQTYAEEYFDNYGTCVECTTDHYCHDPYYPYPEDLRCVGWNQAGEDATFTCEECVEDGDCGLDGACQTEYADEYRWSCVECTDNTDCETPTGCCGLSGRDWECQPCGS